MSYNDKKFGNLFPTRTGTQLGGANERQMLDQVGGAGGYRKNFRVEPDGTTTMLTTKNGQPQFQTLVDGRSDESKNKAGLASGAVFVSTIGATYYTRTSAVAAYAAPGAKLKLVDRIDKTMIGTQPADKSATTALVATSPQTIVRCPSSLFTGKMRLYVQCLYGSLDALPAELQLVDTGTTIPSLIYAGVPLDTSCGIYLNEATAKHYLISVTSGNAHELIRAPGVRWLEKKLLDPVVPGVEKAKIEAYLLAQSYPSPPQGMDLPPRIASGLAYGWHFDWAGKYADCVGIETSVNPGDLQPCYKTTHYRITFSFEDGYITGRLETISESLFRNNRALRILCTPNWADSVFTKLGFKFLPEFGGGTLYAYYSHQTETYPGSSTLQVTTWTAEIGSTVPRSGTRSPSTLNPDSISVPGGQGYAITTTAEHLVDRYTLSIGSFNVSIESSSYSTSEYGADSATCDPPDPSASAFGSGGVPLGAFYGGPPPHMITSGPEISGAVTTRSWYWQPIGVISVSAGSGTFGTTPFTGSVLQESKSVYISVGTSNAAWSTFSGSIGTIKDGYMIWFPAFMDAEAVYAWGRQEQVDTHSGDTTPVSGPGWEKWVGLGPDVGPADEIISTYQTYWDPNGGSATGGPTPYTREERLATPLGESLMCGNYLITPPTPLAVSAFLDGSSDTAPVFMDVRSSTRGAIYSAMWSVNINNAPLTFGGGWSTYTGWA